MREALEASILDVSNGFLRMQSVALEQLSLIREALVSGSFRGLGEATGHLEQDIDDLEHDLEAACLAGIARHQPVASDLRFYLTVFKSLADIERVGDYARQTGRDLEELSGSLRAGPLQDVLPLVSYLAEMLEKLAFAFAERDLAAARAVSRIDDDVDALYEQLQRASLTRVLEDARDLPTSLRVSRLARSLERLGDHVVNVAERLETWLANRPGAARSDAAR
ncbi:phosphate signaling complex protein PhoU [Deinococcus pimensis]|uniref:phosphate signaling complex protein PhoU n=1 Tax=Deinococcus pimensis TaxID=309888 RepID=UPI00048399BB|nr:phosphate signaling complex protein PhoU [Deinococcus pimensis]